MIYFKSRKRQIIKQQGGDIDEEFEKVKASEYNKWLNLIRAGKGFISLL